MVRLMSIAVGGAAGALLRYLVSGWVHRGMGAAFPWGTLVVNVAGCLFIGLMGAVITGPLLLRGDLRVGILVGLLGAFTTFSTFGWETLMLVNDGRWALATGNLLLSNGLGLAAVYFGYHLAQRIWGV